jgi:DNA invertase Pin-like site-specific DNA recombinase
MLGAISTFEHDLLLERQREGVELAKMKGTYLGRLSKVDDNRIKEIKSLFDKSTNKALLAKKFVISRRYLYSIVK